MKKHFCFFGFFLLQSSALFAQIVNDGVKLTIEKDALLYVNGTYYHKEGEILNNGQMVLEGNGQWDNYGRNKVFAPASVGTVEFNAVNLAFAGYTTNFPHLVLKGSGIYDLKAKVEVRLTLNIEDAEIRVAAPEALTLLNESPLSLRRNKGFINTSLGVEGSFLRSMKADEEYLFPMGTKTMMRFVVLKPKDKNENAVAVSFIYKDPSAAGYSRLSKTNTVTEVNDQYYHILKRMSGTSGIDAMFQVSPTEKFSSVVTWVRNIQWDRALSATVQNNIAFLPELSQAFLHKNADLPLANNVAFAFGQITNAGPLSFYNAFSPDGDGKNDTWEVKNIDLFPDNDLKIFDRSGNLVHRVNGYSSAKFWDGQNATSGTYVYILRVKIDGADQYFKGVITMVKN
ncbi:gliding motility-associated C-terminal domain-containing protein [Pedobacter sp.]